MKSSLDTHSPSADASSSPASDRPRKPAFGVFWGKLDRSPENEVTDYHPLADHCIDVACVAEALLANTILGRRFAHLAGQTDLGAIHVSRLAVLAALHDLGKYNVGFQRKGHDPRGHVAGHVSEFATLLGAGRSRHRAALARALSGLDLDSWFDADGDLKGLLLASVSHHGKPASLDGALLPGVWDRDPVLGLDPFVGIDELVTIVRSAFPVAFSTPDAAPLCSTPSFQHAFAGLVQLADWIGSDRRWFSFSRPDEAPRAEKARRVAADALATLGLDAAVPRRALGESPLNFERIAPGRTPRAAQAVVLDLPPSSDARLVVLEAETGAGKTEAALAYFARAYQRGEVDGLYFALPTRTAATQIHRRIVAAVGSLFPEGGRPPVVLAVPGYLVVDDAEGVRLPGFEVHWQDQPSDAERHRRWASEMPKRFLAGAIVIGTIDQVLLSTLAVGHAHLRSTSLLRHLLIVDEVHASDAYMNRLLESVLAHHFEAGGQALLMSATLGTTVRHRFEQLLRRSRSAVPKLSETVTLAYPSVRVTTKHECAETSIHGTGLAKQIDLVCEPWMEDAGRVASEALRHARAGARVIVLRNTVRDCVEVQLAVEAQASPEDAALLVRIDGLAVPHHGRFAQGDRRRLDDALEASFGIPGSASGVIVCATQTVQQSLDLDADIMLTDLAPVDVLLQRAGRVHRHVARRVRPPGYETARLLVLVPDGGDLEAYLSPKGIARGPAGLGSVYPDLRILEATWRLVRERRQWNVPEDCRLLVEQSTHPEALDRLVCGRDDRWREHAVRMMGSEAASSVTAELQLVHREESFGEPSVAFPPGDERITTRLGAEARQIELVPPLRSQLGADIRQFAIPPHLFPRDCDAECANASLDPEHAIRFDLGSFEFIYDRLGLRRSASPKEKLS